MEDGQTLFDYNVGLNDIVQLLIRSQTDHPDSPATKDSSGVGCSSISPPDSKCESHNSSALVSPAAMETTSIDNDSSFSTSTVNETKPDASITSNATKNGFKSCSPAQDTQSPTSSRNTLVDPGIGMYKVRMTDVNILEMFAWFCIWVAVLALGQLTESLVPYKLTHCQRHLGRFSCLCGCQIKLETKCVSALSLLLKTSDCMAKMTSVSFWALNVGLLQSCN